MCLQPKRERSFWEMDSASLVHFRRIMNMLRMLREQQNISMPIANMANSPSKITSTCILLMYLYIYICICLMASLTLSTYIVISTNICMYMYIKIYIYIFTYLPHSLHTYIYIFTYIHIYDMYTLIYIHTYIYIHGYTCMLDQMSMTMCSESYMRNVNWQIGTNVTVKIDLWGVQVQLCGRPLFGWPRSERWSGKGKKVKASREHKPDLGVTSCVHVYIYLYIYIYIYIFIFVPGFRVRGPPPTYPPLGP